MIFKRNNNKKIDINRYLIKENLSYMKDKSRMFYVGITTVLVFILLCLFNQFIPVMRSLPDEMGAVALAANWAGYDWSYVLTHPENYYGSGQAFFLYPVFLLVKDPMIAYQCLLGVGAFFRSLTVYIACKILIDFYGDEFTNCEIILLGIISVFFSPTRTSNIDNEPMLTFICWLIIYLILLLQYADTEKKKTTYSFYLACVLGVSYISHTRALTYIVAIIPVLFIYYFFNKKMLVKLPALGILTVTFIISYIVVLNIQNKLFTNYDRIDSNAPVSNSTQALINSLTDGLVKFFSKRGMQGIADLFCCNLWGVFIFSGGLISIIIIYLYQQTKSIIIEYGHKKSINISKEYLPTVYCMVGFLITLLGLCLKGIDGGINVRVEQSNISRGHFYLRYYGNFFSPMFLLITVKLLKNKIKISHALLSRIILLYLVIVGYCLLGCIKLASLNHLYDLDWFYYFAPFTLKISKWPNSIQDLGYFWVATNVVLVFFVVLINVYKKRNKLILLLLLLFFFIWEYVYGVINFDKEYASSENYYLSANASYDLWKMDSTIFDGCDTIFYVNSIFGPQYIMQFIFLDKKVITDLTLLDTTSGDNIIISNKLLEELEYEYSYVKLDDNEYLYINSEIRKSKLYKLGYLVINDD